MVKKLQICLVLLVIIFSIAQSVHAGFNVPGYVHSVGKVKNAQKKAKRNKQPITFIYTDKKTNCGLATAASKDIFNGLKKHSVIVYADRSKDWKKLPAIVKNGLNSPKSGKYIPKTVIVNSSLSKIICIIPYAEENVRRNLIANAKSVISRK